MNEAVPRAGAVIVGAGNSQRMGIDKVFLPLAGKPLLAWSVDTCQHCELIDQVVVVLNERSLNLGRELVADKGWSKVMEVCLGGKRRQDSVRQGLKELTDCEWVVIHDCARPFLTTELIRDGLKAAQRTGSATAAVPVKDTVKLGSEDGIVVETLSRERLWSVQTPQVFRFDIINGAHEQITDNVTDDASMVERLGYTVKLYMGSYNNVKITTPEDMMFAETLARAG